MFVWAVAEIRAVLGDEGDNVASEFIEVYGAKRGGNWEGKNILELIGTPEQREKLAGARAKLFGARKARVHPGRDEKVLTSWNGLMMAAFAEVAVAFTLADASPGCEKTLLPGLRSDRLNLNRAQQVDLACRITRETYQEQSRIKLRIAGRSWRACCGLTFPNAPPGPIFAGRCPTSAS